MGGKQSFPRVQVPKDRTFIVTGATRGKCALILNNFILSSLIRSLTIHSSKLNITNLVFIEHNVFDCDFETLRTNRCTGNRSPEWRLVSN